MSAVMQIPTDQEVVYTHSPKYTPHTIEDFLLLYEKYHDELFELSQVLRPLFHTMQERGYDTTFGDVEGEILYMLVRESKPRIIFEISPSDGWSTNYLLAALTRNASGVLHSFELSRMRKGCPMEEIIRGNQLLLGDQQRLIVHIGDAREEVEKVPGTIDLVLIDSEHSAKFAQWYTEKLFPRVHGPILVQDIAFWDCLESSSEAHYMWEWASREGVDVTLIGDIEHAVRRGSQEARAGFAERRVLRSNAILFSHPLVRGQASFTLPKGAQDVLQRVERALLSGDTSSVYPELNGAVVTVMDDRTRVNRHRLLMKAAECYRRLGNAAEARRCCQRALGVVFQSDFAQRRNTLPEMFLLSLRQCQWRILHQSLMAIALEPRFWHTFLLKCWRFFREVVHL